MLLTPQNLLALTNCGLDIYEFVYRNLLPRKDMRQYLELGRPLPNPFVAGGQLLIEHTGSLYEHRDLSLPLFKGNALDFAGHYLRTATGNELYFLLNQQMRLGLRIPSEELLAQLENSPQLQSLPRLSYFEPPISNTRPSESLSLPELYYRICGPRYGQVTEQLRQLEGKDARQYKAAHFPYVTFGGTFEKRGDKHLLQPSGLLVIDLDDLPELEATREALIAETHYETELLFVSPSGRGLKWVTSYDYRRISHLNHFLLLCSHLEALYGLEPDESGKDISRACFLPKDEKIFLHRKYLLTQNNQPPNLPFLTH